MLIRCQSCRRRSSSPKLWTTLGYKLSCLASVWTQVSAAGPQSPRESRDVRCRAHPPFFSDSLRVESGVSGTSTTVAAHRLDDSALQSSQTARLEGAPCQKPRDQRSKLHPCRVSSSRSLGFARRVSDLSRSDERHRRPAVQHFPYDIPLQSPVALHDHLPRDLTPRVTSKCSTACFRLSDDDPYRDDGRVAAWRGPQPRSPQGLMQSCILTDEKHGSRTCGRPGIPRNGCIDLVLSLLHVHEVVVGAACVCGVWSELDPEG